MENKYQTPALHLACASGKLRVVESLLESCGDEILELNEDKNTALHVAVLSGNSEILEKLVARLDEGSGDVSNADGDTPLHLAVAPIASLDMISILIASGADPTCKNNAGKTPLHLAWEHDDKFTLLKMLVNENLRRLDSTERLLRMLNVNFSMGKPMLRIIALHFAVQYKHNLLLQTLFDIDEGTKDDILINYREASKPAENALHKAVLVGDFSVFSLLLGNLDKSCNIDRVNDNGETPLQLAVREKQMKMAIFLIASGASLFLKDENNRTPADVLNEMAKVQYFQEPQSRFAQDGADDGVEELRIALLHFLIQVPDEVAEHLLDFDKTLCKNILRPHPLTRETALHAAVRSGKFELLKCCLKNIIDVSATSIDVPDSLRETPLHLSLKEGNVKMAELLLEFQADPKHIPLQLAVIDHGLVKKLLEKLIAEPDAVDISLEMDETETKKKIILVALHVACETPNEKVVNYLLGNKEQAEALTIEKDQLSGESAAHAAVRGGSIDVLKMVLNSNNSAALCTNRCDQTPLHFALAKGNVEMVKLLENAGAKHSYDQKGAGRFHFAARASNASTLEHLVSSSMGSGGAVSDFEFELNEATSGAGLTPLHYAAWNGNAESVKWLLRNGAEKSLQTRDKVEEALPWQWAAMGVGEDYSRSDSFRELIYYHAQVDKVLFPGKNNPKAWQKAFHIMEKHTKTDLLDYISWWVLSFIEDGTDRDVDSKYSHTKRIRMLDAGLLACSATFGDTYTNKKLAKVLKMAVREDQLERVVNLVNDSHLLEWAARRAEDGGSLEVVKPLVQLVVDMNHESFDWQLRLAFTYAFDEKNKRREFREFLATCCRNTGLNEMIKEVVKENVKSVAQVRVQDWVHNLSTGDRIFFEGERKSSLQKLEDDVPLPYWLAKLVQHTKAIVYKPDSSPNNQTQQLKQKETEVLDLVKRVDEFAQEFVKDYPNEKGRSTGRTALHWATILKDEEIVRALREKGGEELTNKERNNLVPFTDVDFWKNCRADVFDDYGKPPCWYARNDKVLLKFLKWDGYMDNLKNDRELFVDALNAILVGAALISSVTFAGFLSPPLDYSFKLEKLHRGDQEAPPYIYVKNAGVAIFFVCNSLSFFFGMASALAGVTGVLPSPDEFNYDVVVKLRKTLLVAAVMLVFSIVFVLFAFAAAGFAGLPPLMRYQVTGIWTACVGGLLCLAMLFWFLKALSYFLPYPAWLHYFRGRGHLYSSKLIHSCLMSKSLNLGLSPDQPMCPRPDALELDPVETEGACYTRGRVPWEDGLHNLTATSEPVDDTVVISVK